ncbi:MAG TPA: type II toxin-antitoxin system VapC family toxin [Actinomycetales bacterium]|nr:type II toxin-antitoxin system VapC family toxin [Actinomycetales bacterium]
MPGSGSPVPVLVDTSIAVALLSEDHPDHLAVLEHLAGHELGLSGHAAFETYSVLTRLPTPARRAAAVVTRLLDVNFPHSRFLSAARAGTLLSDLAGRGLAGGSVYDALVGAAAAEHGMTLVSRDLRARETYRAVGADVEVLP